jgi:hypothetical protein
MMIWLVMIKKNFFVCLMNAIGSSKVYGIVRIVIGRTMPVDYVTSGIVVLNFPIMEFSNNSNFVNIVINFIALKIVLSVYSLKLLLFFLA